MYPTLPVELYRPIVANVVDVPTVLTLLVVSCTLSAEAERILYHSVSLNADDLSPAGQCSRFFQTLVDNRRIAQHICRLDIRRQSHLLSAADTTHLAALGRLMSAALPAAVNLQALSCNVRPLIPRPLRQYPFRLKEFQGGFADEADFRDFLTAQPDLAALTVDRITISEPPPRELCTDLAVLAGLTDVVRALLPGRAVRALRWILAPTERVEPSVAEMGDSLKHLRSLSLICQFRRLPLEALVQHVPDLLYLELVGEWMICKTLLPRLPRLRGLTLSGRHVSSDAAVRAEIDASVAWCFGVLGALRFVEVHQPGAALIRWERGRGAPAPCAVRAGAKHDWTAAIA